MEWLRMCRQVREGAPVEVDEAKVTLKFLLVARLWHLEHSLNFARSQSQAILGDVFLVLDTGFHVNALF